MLPSGTVTFLFTDIEGSTPLWEQKPQAMRAALERHHAILHRTIRENDGQVFQIVGDAFCAAFAFPNQAVAAAVAAQRRLVEAEWGETGPLRVRMGIHTGPSELTDGEYRSNHTFNRVARIMAAGHGGQVVVSLEAVELARRHLPQEIGFKDLGEQSMKGMSQAEHLYQVLAPGLRSEFPALNTKSAPRHNLPLNLTPFLGRENEMGEVATLLRDPGCRLVTLAGPGGIGKTRLAIQAAENLLPAFPQGAWFVPLDSLASPEFLAEAIGAALDLSFSGHVPPVEQLLESLRHKELLLTLDNFEHLLPHGTGLLIEILHKAPGVKLLVTSRERLNLQAEWVLEVHGLDYPKNGQNGELEDYPATTLFLQHARRASGRTVPDEDRSCVAHITRLVEGAPLALELAAAWARALSCREIAGEIEKSLVFLQARQPDLPERHRSMQAIFDYSWQLLSGEERLVFRRLAVFQGGFEREAASQVASASLATLAALVDKSLVQHQPDGRYRLHELLRQFAAAELERAGETELAQDRHLAYYLELAERAGPELWRAQEKVWLDRLESEYDNLREAFECSLSPRGELGVPAGLRLVVAVDRFWLSQGHFTEAIGWLEALLAHPQVPDHQRLYANGLRLAATWYDWGLGDIEKARSGLERSLAIAEVEGDTLLLAQVLSDFGNFQMNWGDLAVAQEYLERSLAFYREQKHEPGIATVLRRVGHISSGKQDHPRARAYYQQSLQAWKALGNKTSIAQTLEDMGSHYAFTGHSDEARVCLEESLAIARDLNNSWEVIDILNRLSLLELIDGEVSRAIACIEESLRLARDTGVKSKVALNLYFLGEIARYQGDYPKAHSFLQEALDAIHETGDTSLHQDVLISKGFVFFRQGEARRAREFFKESFMINQGPFIPRFNWRFLIGMAGLSAASGQPDQAARWLGTAQAVIESNSILFTDKWMDYPDYAHILDLARAQLDESTFNRLNQEGRAMAAEGLDQVLEYAQQNT